MLDKEFKFVPRRYERFIEEKKSRYQRNHHRVMNLFFDWIIDEYCTDDDEYDPVVLPGFRNPLKSLFKHYNDRLPSESHLSESNKPVLPLSKVDQARKYLFSDEFEGFSSAFNLHDLFYLDWHNVDKQAIEFDDIDCAWRVDPKNSKKYQLWSPARAVALYTLLRMPLRGQQILWLDSGEGDAELPVLTSKNEIEWIENTLQTAGCQQQKQGFLTKRENNAVGMYITTNKTSTSNSGYHVPYMPPELAELIIRLRVWQSKYNTLKRLTKWTEIKLPTEKNKRILKAQGSQAFLFRAFDSRKGEPHKTSLVFGRYLPAVLHEIQEKDEGLAWKEKSVYKSDYTPHSMRTSLITAYVVDGGVPIHIISKLVGHASIVMTIYYTKIGQGRMNSEISRAEKIALTKSVDRLQDIIINDSIDKAKGELFSKDSAFLSTIGDDWPKSSYQITDKGICAMGGGGCESGGMDELGVATNGPVSIGYLGRRNCVRCKYFITGPAFIGGLAALCNEVILETNSIANEMSTVEKQREDLKDEKYDCEISGKAFAKHRELRNSEANYEEKAMKIDVVLSDFAAIHSLITQSRALLSQSDYVGNKNLIASDSIFEGDCRLEESGSDFRLLCDICENATIYKSASATRAIPKRSQMLDKLADMNGFRPLMFSLTEEEQLAVGNQAAELIKTYASSWAEVDRLLEGEIKMDDVLLQKSGCSLHEKFKSLIRQSEPANLLSVVG